MKLNQEAREAGNIFLEQEAESTFAAGKALADLVGTDKRFMSQLRGLEVLAYSTARFSDLEDYVMSRMGRESQRKQAWSQPLPREGHRTGQGELFGDQILRHMGKIRRISRKAVSEEIEQLALSIYIARGWIRRLVAAFLYHRSKN